MNLQAKCYRLHICCISHVTYTNIFRVYSWFECFVWAEKSGYIWRPSTGINYFGYPDSG